jgi:hypothetical protein
MPSRGRRHGAPAWLCCQVLVDFGQPAAREDRMSASVAGKGSPKSPTQNAGGDLKYWTPASFAVSKTDSQVMAR